MREIAEIAFGLAVHLWDAAGLFLAASLARIALLFAGDGRFRRYLARGGPFFRGGL